MVGHGEQAAGKRADEQSEEQRRADEGGGGGDQQRHGEHQRQQFARVGDAEVYRLFASQREDVERVAFVPNPGEAGADDKRGGKDEVGAGAVKAGVGDCLKAGVGGGVKHARHQVGEFAAQHAEDDADEQQAVDVAREQRQEGGKEGGRGGGHQGGVEVELPQRWACCLRCRRSGEEDDQHFREEIERVQADDGRGEDAVGGERLENHGRAGNGAADEQHRQQFLAAIGQDEAPVALGAIAKVEDDAAADDGGEREQAFMRHGAPV